MHENSDLRQPNANLNKESNETALVHKVLTYTVQAVTKGLGLQEIQVSTKAHDALLDMQADGLRPICAIKDQTGASISTMRHQGGETATVWIKGLHVQAATAYELLLIHDQKYSGEGSGGETIVAVV